MNTVRVYLVPIFGSDVMSQWVFIIVCRNFRIRCCTRSKEHQHRIVSARHIFWFCKVCREKLNVFVKAVPGLACAAYHDFQFQCCISTGSLIHFTGNIAVCRTNDGIHFTCFETIFEIFAGKQICRRDRDGPNLMKRKDGEPELEMTFQNEHYLISALNSEITEIICCHISKFCDITECEITLSSIFRHVKHRQFIRTFFCHYVNYII